MLTDEQQQNNYPAATLEDGGVDPSPALQLEESLYTIDKANVVPKPPGIPDYENNNGFINPNPYGNSFAVSEKVYRLNGSNTTQQKGLDMVLKVMSGDRINIYGKSYQNRSSGN